MVRFSRFLHSNRVAWIGSIAVALFAFWLYFPHIHPGVGPVRFLDAIQYQINATVLGVSHPPGYPLYALLGKLITVLPLIGRYAPFGDNGAYRLGLLSAVAAALTVLVTCRIIYRLTQHVGAALVGALMLALAVGFWVQATYTELYPLYNLFVATNFLLLIAWIQTRKPVFYFLSVAVYAFSFHLNIPALMLLPAWLWAVLVTDHQMLTRPRNLLWTGLIVLAAVALYLYVPLRAFIIGPAAFCNYCPADWRELPAFLSGAVWRDLNIVFGVEPRYWLQRWADSGYQMMLQFWPVGVILGGIGWWRLVRKQWRIGGMFTLALAATWFFVVGYNVVDWADFMTPVYTLFVPLIGVGFYEVWAWARGSADERLSQSEVGWQKLLRAVILIGLIVLPIGYFAAVYRNNDQIVGQFQQDNNGMINHWAARDLLTRMEPDAWLLTPPTGTDGFNQTWAVRYVSWAEGLRPELQVVYAPGLITPGPEPGYIHWDDARDRLREQPVYVVELNDERLQQYALWPVVRDDGWPVGWQIVGERSADGLDLWISAEKYAEIEDEVILP